MEMLDGRVRARAGAACVFHQGAAWALARLASIRTDGWGVRLAIEPEPAPGTAEAAGASFEVRVSWELLRAWPTHWTAPLDTWVLVFDPAAIEAFTTLAAERAGDDAGARARAFSQWLDQRLAAWNAAEPPAGPPA